MNPKSIIDIRIADRSICQIDTENPDLAEFVKIVISDDDINENNIVCKTDIENFDINSFQDLVRLSVKEIKLSLKNESGKYEQIMKSVVLGQDVEEFYRNLEI